MVARVTQEHGWDLDAAERDAASAARAAAPASHRVLRDGRVVVGRPDGTTRLVDPADLDEDALGELSVAICKGA